MSVPATATSRPFHLAATTGRPARWWLGGRLSIKVAAVDSDGRFSTVEVDDPRGAAPPMHIHHAEDETLYVLEGQLAAYVGDDTFDAGPGDFVFMPRGVPHSYLVRSERARGLFAFSPGGFERFFVEMGLPIVDGEPEPAPVIPDPETFTRKLAPYEVEIVGPPPTLG
jgi:quercetin dioxygenase-like cupin family protein